MIQSSSLIPTQGEAETLPFSEKTLESQQKHARLLQEWEQKRKVRQMALPTDDKLVQARLREIGEPIILFGEQPAERRERLRELLIKRNIDEGMPAQALQAAHNQDLKEPDELFYTEGTPALKAARIWIAKYSIPRAKARVESSKRKRDEEESTSSLLVQRDQDTAALFSSFSKFTNTSSQVGDERFLSFCSFSPSTNSDENLQLATANSSGLCKLWNVADNRLVQTFTGHQDRATSIVYHPQAASPSTVNLASSSFDSTVMLWSLESSTPLTTLRGHTHRVHRVAFHPSGRYVGSTSFDLTWRLWDVEQGKELLEQEGHSKSVYGIAFQNDGSLVSTGGADSIGRIWDLRSGKSIYVLRGHSKQILGMDFSPNGYQLLTCSEDNTVRIWDLRKRRCIYTIPAHASTISHAKYHPTKDLIISCSFDHTVKLWSAIDWTPVRTLTTEGKVMGVDISLDCKYIATANYDRTWRLFSHDPLL